MSRQRSVRGDDGPTVGQSSRVFTTGGEHRLYRQRQARPEHQTAIRRADIWDVRILMHLPADAVAAVVTDNASAAVARHCLHRVANASQAIASRGRRYRALQRFFSIAEQL